MKIVVKLFLLEGQEMLLLVIESILLFAKGAPIFKRDNKEVHMYDKLLVIMPIVFQVDFPKILILIGKILTSQL